MRLPYITCAAIAAASRCGLVAATANSANMVNRWTAPHEPLRLDAQGLIASANEVSIPNLPPILEQIVHGMKVIFDGLFHEKPSSWNGRVTATPTWHADVNETQLLWAIECLGEWCDTPGNYLHAPGGKARCLTNNPDGENVVAYISTTTNHLMCSSDLLKSYANFLRRSHGSHTGAVRRVFLPREATKNMGHYTVGFDRICEDGAGCDDPYLPELEFCDTPEERSCPWQYEAVIEDPTRYVGPEPLEIIFQGTRTARPTADNSVVLPAAAPAATTTADPVPLLVGPGRVVYPTVPEVSDDDDEMFRFFTNPPTAGTSQRTVTAVAAPVITVTLHEIVTIQRETAVTLVPQPTTFLRSGHKRSAAASDDDAVIAL
ncbi:hypothetical protein QBC46DRAFT_409423 [Diplogelasinospora grovesii]|uniref:Uncharacterized protein n=1 Tax=Diplogelasinospora grovesii TaxID=303347 RepID=A0AAN6N690_9PEZI|nr:hypothetical protein QBC46DRAFT_409423 [Diplogelasinospora grovesii]